MQLCLPNNGELNILELQDTKTAIGALGLPLPKFVPRRYRHRNVGSWSGHLAFANDLIVAKKLKQVFAFREKATIDLFGRFKIVN